MTTEETTQPAAGGKRREEVEVMANWIMSMTHEDRRELARLLLSPAPDGFLVLVPGVKEAWVTPRYRRIRRRLACAALAFQGYLDVDSGEVGA